MMAFVVLEHTRPGGRQPIIAKAASVYAVVLTQRGRSFLSHLPGWKRGEHAPVFWTASTKKEARHFISDNYANGNWPVGSLQIVKAYAVDMHRDVMYL
jgi:hypothetical protein